MSRRFRAARLLLVLGALSGGGCATPGIKSPNVSSVSRRDELSDHDGAEKDPPEKLGPADRIAAKDKKADKYKEGYDWNERGRQARSDRLVEQENDPLRKWLVSP